MMVEPSVDGQLGRITQQLDDIKDRGAERQRQAEASAAEVKRLLEIQNERSAAALEKLGAEVRTVKHDVRGLEQRDESRAYLAKLAQAATDTKIAEIADDLKKIQEPVEQLMKMRERWGGIIMVLMGLGTVASFFITTLGKWIFESFTGPHKP